MVARGLGDGAEENYRGNMKELFGVMGLFRILIVVEVTQLYGLVELIGLYILKSIFY